MKGKLVGEINGIKILSSSKVPKNEVWIEDGLRNNPTFRGGLLDTIAFKDKAIFVRGKIMFGKLQKLLLDTELSPTPELTDQERRDK